FDALGCRDLARVDFMLDEDGNHWLLEINTIPGFTSHSLVPMAAARSGIEFDDLVDRLAHMASRRLED
ncbi:MAG: D-alanine--D-alanine ligase, partial [Phycisphaerales bacterium]|nr:D-alanine--D-alanine ligase [Phycisphaerales bacterium]